MGSLIKLGLGGLAKSGIIRGSVGKLLGGSSGKAVARAGTSIVSSLPRMGTSPAVVGKILRTGGAVGAAVAVSAAGSAIATRFRKDGTPYKRRSMQVTNQRALKRALRRVEGFEKLVRRAFTVRELKPRKSRSCR